MTLYSNRSIIEGEYYPDAIIWHGNIMPLSKSAPIGWALRIKLPWWIRRYSSWHRREMIHQLMFGVWQLTGPEKYEVWFSPVERG